MVWKMTCRPLPKANLVQAEIYQSGAHQHWHFYKCDLVNDTGELMCWTSASADRKLLFPAMKSAAAPAAAENVCAFASVWTLPCSDKTMFYIWNPAAYQSIFRSNYPEPCEHLTLNFKSLTSFKSFLSQPLENHSFVLRWTQDSLLFHTVQSIFGSALPKFGHSHL